MEVKIDMKTNNTTDLKENGKINRFIEPIFINHPGINIQSDKKCLREIRI